MLTFETAIYASINYFKYVSFLFGMYFGVHSHIPLSLGTYQKAIGAIHRFFP